MSYPPGTTQRDHDAHYQDDQDSLAPSPCQANPLVWDCNRRRCPDCPEWLCRDCGEPRHSCDCPDLEYAIEVAEYWGEDR